MNSYTLGPPTSGDHLHQVVSDLNSVRHFLEAPYELSAKDWQEACDGFGHVVLAAQRLAETLATRCPSPEHAAAVADAHDLLLEAIERLSPHTGTAPA
jgi:hypothetical protein